MGRESADEDTPFKFNSHKHDEVSLLTFVILSEILYNVL